MAANKDIPVLLFETREDWETWLSRHYDDPGGLWFKFAKKTSGLKTPSYAEVLEAALSYGWIDSQRLAHDDKYYLQKFTPRGPRSIWSRLNRDKAVELIKAGKMKPSGLRAVERAKSTGEWGKAYEPQSRMTVPPDFQKELDKNREAGAFFRTLNTANRYAILFRIQSARTARTRKNSINTFIKMLSAKEEPIS